MGDDGPTTLIHTLVEPVGDIDQAGRLALKARQAQLARVAVHRPLADLADELADLPANAGPATRRALIELAEGLPEQTRTRLLAAVAKRDLLDKAVAKEMRAAGITRGKAPAGLVRFKPADFDVVGDPPKPGQLVTVVDPGYFVDGVPVRRPLVAINRNRAAAPANEVMKMGEEAAKREIARVVEGSYSGGLRVELSDDFSIYNNTGKVVAYKGKIYDSTGRQVGEFSRELRRDGKDYVAVHEELRLDPKYQGSGFAAEFNGNLYDWYRRSGFARVTLDANIDVGGYAWATQGFDFADSYAVERYMEGVTHKLDWLEGKVEFNYNNRRIDRMTPATFRHEYPGMSPEEFARQSALLRQLLADVRSGKRRVTAYELSQLGRKPGQGRTDWWIGKMIMLGHELVWQGAKLL
jgi:hypothetical protein